MKKTQTIRVTLDDKIIREIDAVQEICQTLHAFDNESRRRIIEHARRILACHDNKGQ